MAKLQTFYCHGLPGSPEEIAALVPDGSEPPIGLKPMDLAGFESVTSELGCETVRLIGFSLGAMSAITIAAHKADIVKELILIAPAAPLELGDFLPHMVGRPVFKAAKMGALPFKVFTFIQRLGVLIAPNKIIEAMFDGSPKADTELLGSFAFKQSLLGGLELSLGLQNTAYRKTIGAYVRPWSHHLTKIQCPVTIHHGTLDKWTPLAMSYCLERNIKAPVDLQLHKALGHYSTLHKALRLTLAK